jgi:hypothetical protein
MHSFSENCTLYMHIKITSYGFRNMTENNINSLWIVLEKVNITGREKERERLLFSECLKTFLNAISCIKAF